MDRLDGSQAAVLPLLRADDALFLDFDGTLAEIAPRPEAVQVAASLPALLAELRAALGGALAVISGRQLADVDGFLAPLRLAGAGMHGAELRPDPAQPPEFAAHPAIPRIAAALRSRFADAPGVLVEDKAASVALHYRAAPELRQACEQALRALAAPHGLEIVPGKMVFEARPAGVSKGRGLAALAAHTPFSGRRPVFVGDDVTDEAGFAAAQARGGIGIKVGDGVTAARHRCAGVPAVHAWLAANLAHLQTIQP